MRFKKKDELLQELQELQDEDIDREILNIPTAPSHNLPQTSQKGNVWRFLVVEKN